MRSVHPALVFFAEGELSTRSDDGSSEARLLGKCLALALGLPGFALCSTLLAQDLPFQSHELEAAFGLRSTDPQFILRHEIGLLGKPLAENCLDLPPPT